MTPLGNQWWRWRQKPKNHWCIRVKVLNRSLSSSPGSAERPQLGPHASGKHQEPATPNVALRTALSSEMASQSSWQDMTFHSGWQQRKLCDSRLLAHSWGIPPSPSKGLSLFPEKSKSLQVQSDVKEQRAAGGKLLRHEARRACKPRLSWRSIAEQTKPGTKSKLAFCVCSDTKFCHILVPLLLLAASASQLIGLQSSSLREVSLCFADICCVFSSSFFCEKALTRPPLSRQILVWIIIALNRPPP